MKIRHSPSPPNSDEPITGKGKMNSVFLVNNKKQQAQANEASLKKQQQLQQHAAPESKPKRATDFIKSMLNSSKQETGK